MVSDFTSVFIILRTKEIKIIDGQVFIKTSPSLQSPKWYFLSRYVLERLGIRFFSQERKSMQWHTVTKALGGKSPYILQDLGWASGPQTRAGDTTPNTCQSRVEVSAAVAKILFHCLPKNMQGKTTPSPLLGRAKIKLYFNLNFPPCGQK